MANASKEYARTLRRLRADLAEAEASVSRLRQMIALLAEHADLDVAETEAAGKPKRKRGKLIGLAEDVLREVGRPLHITDIITGMQAKGLPPRNPKTLRYSLTRSLDRKEDEGKVFTKPQPATYGLREWEGRELPLGNGQR